MEENLNNNQVPQQPEPEKAAPPAVPVPVPAHSQTKLWLRAVAVLYALSMFAAFAVISKSDAARKLKPNEMDISKLTGLMQSKKDAVGVIPLYGVITQGNSSRSWEGGSQQIAKRIKLMAEKKDVKAILLDINTPGGSVGAVQEIYSAILRAKRETKKPFVARFGEVSASGGYYVAAACDVIYAQPGTITGSIGVIFSVSNFEGLMKKVGMKNETIKSGKFKDIGSPVRDMTAEEHKLLQGLIDDSYAQFVTAVAEGRQMPLEKVKTLADGRIYSGGQALKEGLIDKLGDLQDALDAAGELGKIGKNPRVVTTSDPLENLMSLMDSKLQLFGSKAVSEAMEIEPRLEYRWYGR
ncbi:MAG TPA: signal peptide peptidase SppA [Elusimicrobiales bacterium]|nr:signal peptide peptidase SppA [Elusimicrobiales bacterium]